MSDFDTIRLTLGLGDDVSDEDVAARIVQLQADADAGVTAATALADAQFTSAWEQGLPAAAEREAADVSPRASWVNTLQVWAPGTVDLSTGQIQIKGYAV